MNSLKTLLAVVANAFEQSGSIRLDDGSEIVFKYNPDATTLLAPVEPVQARPTNEPDAIVEKKKKKYHKPRIVRDRSALYPKISPVLNTVKQSGQVTIDMNPYLNLFDDLKEGGKDETQQVHHLASLAAGYYNRTQNDARHLSYRRIPETTKVTFFLQKGE